MVVFMFPCEEANGEREGGRAGYKEGRSTEMAGCVLGAGLVDLQHEAMLLHLRCIKSIPSPSLVVVGWIFSETETETEVSWSFPSCRVAPHHAQDRRWLGASHSFRADQKLKA